MGVTCVNLYYNKAVFWDFTEDECRPEHKKMAVDMVCLQAFPEVNVP